MLLRVSLPKKTTARSLKKKLPRKKARVPKPVKFEFLKGGKKGLLSEILADVLPPKEVEPVEVVPKPPGAAVPLPTVVEKVPEVGKVLDSYGQVELLSVEGQMLPLYKIKMSELSKQEQKLLDIAKEKAVEEIKIDPDKIPDPAERQRVFTHEILGIIERESKGLHLPPGRIRQLGELAVRDMLGYGPLDPMIADDRLEDIMVTGIGKPVYVYHRKHGMCYTNVVFNDEDSIKYLIDKMARVVGRRIDQQTPLLDARLPDGSRVNATIPPVSLEGPTISIRKFRKDPLTVIDILNYGTLSTDVAAFMWLIVDGLGIKPANVLFAGGTGCGKTTTLNAATTFVPERERIISIEDTAELQLPHRHWVRLETRPPNVEGRGEITMDDLVKNALRMRPDRMVVGEVRGPEARTMFTAMNTGHDGAVRGDSKIQLSNGEIVKIEGLASKLFSSGEVRKEGDFEYVEVNGPSVKTLNEKTLKLEDKKITRVWRKPYRGKLLELRISDGRTIVVTKDHPLYDVGKKVQTADLHAGNHVASPLLIQVTSGRESNLAYLAGYVTGDGCISDNIIQIVEADPALFDDVLAEIGKHSTHKITRLDYDSFRRGEVWDGGLVNSLRLFREPDVGSLCDNSLANYLSGLFDAEGHVNLNSGGIEFSNKSKELVDEVQQLLLRFGIHSSVSSQERDGKGNVGPYHKVSIYGGGDLERFWKHVGFRSKEKGGKLQKLVKGDESYEDVIPEIGTIIKEERLKVGLTQTELSRAIRDRSRSNIQAYERGARNPRRKKLARIAEALNSEVLKKFAASEILWVKVKSIKEVEHDGHVYDLTVDENHNYIANGIIVSNCMGTLHANSAAETITRLTEAPMSVPDMMVPALDVIVMQQRIYHRQKGQIRRVTEIAEVTGLEGGKPQLSRIFKWNPRTDVVEPTGVPSKIKRMIAEFSGMGGSDIEIELEKRAAVLEWMKEEGIRNIFEVGRVIQEYYRDPAAVLKRVRAEKGPKGR